MDIIFDKFWNEVSVTLDEVANSCVSFDSIRLESFWQSLSM